ncbi:MAG: hypothetical protein ACHWZW_05920 [Spirulina sp.]
MVELGDTEFDRKIAAWGEDSCLYKDLTDAKSEINGKPCVLATKEWRYLRGVLVGCTLQEIAEASDVTSKAVTGCLNEYVYLYIEWIYQRYSQDPTWSLAENAPRFRDRCVRNLIKEMGYRPEDVGGSSKLASVPLSYWGYVEKDAPCFGRHEEIAKLKHRIIEEQRQILVIRGLQPSVGTTTLACQLAQTLEAEAGYRIFWFQMENAPTLESFLNQIVQRWAPHIDQSNLTPPAAFRQLLQHLGQSPWLMVLDGVSPQRNPETSWAIYDEYSQLFDPMQTEIHQGCLLMVGSKQIENLRFMRNGVHRSYGIAGLSLKGLALEAVQELLNSQNIVSSNPLDYKYIHEAYFGNPSFIQFAIGAIQKNYKGDLAIFNQERGHTIFRTSEMMDLVREQWQGLDNSEQQICLQMAERAKPLPLDDLERLMQAVVSRGELMGILPDLEEAKFIKVIHRNDGKSIQYELTPLIQRFITRYLDN